MISNDTSSIISFQFAKASTVTTLNIHVLITSPLACCRVTHFQSRFHWHTQRSFGVDARGMHFPLVMDSQCSRIATRVLLSIRKRSFAADNPPSLFRHTNSNKSRFSMPAQSKVYFLTGFIK